MLTSSTCAITQIQPSDIDEGNLVSIYQQALEHSTGLSMLSQRLLRIVISLIDPKMIIDPLVLAYPFYFTVADYQRVFNINYYPKEELERLSRELSLRFTIQDPANPNHSITTGFINDVEVSGGTVKVTVSSAIIPALQAASAKYQLGNATRFSNSSSFLLYERLILLLEQSPNENYGEFKVSIETIKDWFAIKDKYQDKNGNFTYGPFKKKILNKAIEDINKVDSNNIPVCNINIKITENKIGKRIGYITFYVARVHDNNYYLRNKPILNSFRYSLSKDQQTIYDFLLNLNITRQEVETALIRYPLDKLINICEYMDAKKQMGSAYLAAILRNGWTGKGKTDLLNINLYNIDRAININPIQNSILSAFKEFLLSLSTEIQSSILILVLDDFKHSQPELFEHYKKISFTKLFTPENLSLFIIEKAESLLKTTRPELYQDFRYYFSNKNNGISSASKLSKPYFFGREKILSELKNYNIVDSTALTGLLKFSDQHIHANIQYCKKKYANKTKRELSSLIVAAIQRNFCQYISSSDNAMNMQISENTYLEAAKEQNVISVSEVNEREPIKSVEDSNFHKFLDSASNDTLIDFYNKIITSNPNDFRIRLIVNTIPQATFDTLPMIEILKQKPILLALFKEEWKKLL